MDIQKRIREILEKTHLMSLATRDENGLWVSDVIFIFDETDGYFTLYWMSDPDARHSQAISKNDGVAGTITFSTRTKESNLGIQFSGIAEKIEGPRHDLAVKFRTKRGHPATAESEDVLQGDAWYKINLTKMDVIDEAQRGFKKQHFI